MKINAKQGIDALKFGMKQKDAEAVLGKPDRQYKDEDSNIIYLYNDQKLRLTFYEDEAFRLGYIITAHPGAELFSQAVIGKKWQDVESLAKEHGFKSFEKEVFDSLENYFNEPNWMIFQVEFGEVIRIELGAIINDKDEFDWKFKA